MNGTTIAVAVPGADAAALRNAAQVGERFGIEQIWAGDPRGAAANSDETYSMTALAAVAAVTSDIRLGVFASLRSNTQVLKLAEDIGVVDSAARGRVEAGLIVPQATGEFEEFATALLGAFHYWPGAGSDTYAVTPRPQQLWLPRLLVGGSEQLAVRLGAGLAAWPGTATKSHSIAARRTALLFDMPQGVRNPLDRDPVALTAALRRLVDDARAHQLIVILPPSNNIGREIEALGVVVSCAIRCSPHESAQLAQDSLNWLQRWTEF